MPVSITCNGCGDSFEVPPSREKRAKYCSNECKYNHAMPTGEEHPQWEGGKVSVECESCGEGFRVKQSRAETAKYCSEGCQNTGQQRQVDITCEWCGCCFSRPPSAADKSRFCSRRCLRKWMSELHTDSKKPELREREVCECEWCGSVYEVVKSRAEATRFCSPSCHGDWQAENVTGKNHPLWKGGKTPYGKGWNDSKKHAVRVRDQARCQHCGRTEPEHIENFGRRHDIHHITPAREIDDPEERNAKENLITLCRGECHQTWEQMAPLRPDTAAQPAD